MSIVLLVLIIIAALLLLSFYILYLGMPFIVPFDEDMSYNSKRVFLARCLVVITKIICELFNLYIFVLFALYLGLFAALIYLACYIWLRKIIFIPFLLISIFCIWKSSLYMPLIFTILMILPFYHISMEKKIKEYFDQLEEVKQTDKKE